MSSIAKLRYALAAALETIVPTRDKWPEGGRPASGGCCRLEEVALVYLVDGHGHRSPVQLGNVRLPNTCTLSLVCS